MSPKITEDTIELAAKVWIYCLGSVTKALVTELQLFLDTHKNEKKLALVNNGELDEGIQWRV